MKTLAEQILEAKRLGYISNEDILAKYNKLILENNLDPEKYTLNLTLTYDSDDFCQNKASLILEAIPVEVYKTFVTKIDLAQ